MDVILYLSNGYPTIESSVKMANEYAEAGCRIIEIDFPSHNPFLESELIAGRMKKALEVCDDYDKYMDEIVQVHKNLPDVKLLVLSYENTILELGIEKFIGFCIDNNFKDVLIVGLTSDEVKNRCMESGLRVSCYVQYQMLEEEIQRAKESNGFVYMQAKPVPGQGFINEKYPTLKDCIQGLRNHGINRPIYCGVGVHSPEDIEMVKNSGADAAFVGSTILKLQEDIPAMKAKIKEFVAKC